MRFILRLLISRGGRVLDSKGRISHDDAVKKADSICEAFRKKQDAAYISEFDREVFKYPKSERGENP